MLNVVNVNPIKNSLIFYLSKKNFNKKNGFLKSNTIMRGFYKDKILKDKVYVYSSGFLKDVFFRKSLVKKFSLKEENINNIFFFSSLNYKLVNFYFYAQKYYHISLQKYYSKNSFLYKYYKKKKIYKKFSILKNPFWSSFQRYVTLRHRNRNFGYNKKILIKNVWKTSAAFTNSGIVNICKPRTYKRRIFWNRRLDSDCKKVYIYFVTSFYILLNYFLQIFSKEFFNNKNIIYIHTIYILFFKYAFKTFRKRYRNIDSTVRKHKKFTRVLRRCKKYYYIMCKLSSLTYLHTYSNPNLRNSWLNYVFYNKNYNNQYLPRSIPRLDFFKMENNEERIKLFKFLIYLLQLNILDKQISMLKNKINMYIFFKSKLIYNTLKERFNYNFISFQNYCIEFKNYNFLTILSSYNIFFLNGLIVKNEKIIPNWWKKLKANFVRKYYLIAWLYNKIIKVFKIARMLKKINAKKNLKLEKTSKVVLINESYLSKNINKKK